MNRRGETELLLRDEGFISCIFALGRLRAIGLESKMWGEPGLRVWVRRRTRGAATYCLHALPRSGQDTETEPRENKLAPPELLAAIQAEDRDPTFGEDLCRMREQDREPQA
jgi:hypothetical protein